MQTFQIHELLENSSDLTVAIVAGYGNGYSDEQQKFIDGHVMDVTERLRELDPSVKMVISKMDINTPVHEAMIEKESLLLTSDILLYVTPICVSIVKWQLFPDRAGSTVGN